MTNAGQTCIGIERVYVVDPVYDAFVAKVVARAGRLTVGADGADIGPITMPGQIDVIRRHIDDALAAGGRAVLGGAGRGAAAVRAPDRAGRRAGGLGRGPRGDLRPDADHQPGPRRRRGGRAGPTPCRTAWAVRSSAGGDAVAIARRLRSGMASVNSTLTFAGMSTLPFGGVGDSGFGRIHGEDGLREFGRAKAITTPPRPVAAAVDDLRADPGRRDPPRQGNQGDVRQMSVG